MTTKELLEEFLVGQKDWFLQGAKALNRPELYEYEQIIGKSLVEMKEDELIDLMNYLMHGGKLAKNASILDLQNYDSLRNILHEFFEWYIDRHPMRNPVRFSRNKAIQRICADKFVVDTHFMRATIDDLQAKYPGWKYQYCKLMMLLFYSGFKTYAEILSFTDSQVDYQAKSVKLTDRTVHLTDECFVLLMQNHNLNEVVTPTQKIVLFAPCNNSFFHVLIQTMKDERIENLTEQACIRNMTQQYQRWVIDRSQLRLTASILHLLGFYDWFCEQVGQSEADRIICSHGISVDNQTLMNFAVEYGLARTSPTRFKNSLLRYVKNKEFNQ